MGREMDGFFWSRAATFDSKAYGFRELDGTWTDLGMTLKAPELPVLRKSCLNQGQTHADEQKNRP